MKNQSIKAGLIAAALLGGCATLPVPTGNMENSLGTIRAAEEVGAANLPQAKLHLQLAKEQTAGARELLAKEETDMAGFLLMRAEADGQLALALAHENTARADAKTAADKLNQPNN